MPSEYRLSVILPAEMLDVMNELAAGGAQKTHLVHRALKMLAWHDKLVSAGGEVLYRTAPDEPLTRVVFL